jgi:hypothetical protein
MLFAEAVKLLNEGKYVTRHAWVKDGKYLALLPHMPSVWMVATIPNPAAGNWQPLVSDLNADDWDSLANVVETTVVDAESTVQ